MIKKYKELNKFRMGRIIVKKDGDYRVVFNYNKRNKLEHDFKAVQPKFNFITSPAPVCTTKNAMAYAVFPLRNPQGVLLKPRAELKSAGSTDPISQVKLMPSSPVIPRVEISSNPKTYEFQPTEEKDEQLTGVFKMDTVIELRVIDFYLLKDQNYKILTQNNPLQNSQPLPRYGTIAPLHLICADVGIETPKNNVPGNGEDGAYVDSKDYSLFIFDNNGEGEDKGKCIAKCEPKDFRNLSSTAKNIAQEMLEWVPPQKDGIVASTGKPVIGNPGATNFIYATMPERNDSFGNSTAPLKLRFKERHEWTWEKDVQFRYHRLGTGAVAEYKSNPNPDYQKIFTSPDNNNPHGALDQYPNWYFYWHQVAGDFNFGCQADKMYYDSNEYAPTNIVKKSEIIAYHQPLRRIPKWEDKIVLQNYHRRSIFQYVNSLHHENGHRQSYQLHNNKGGFGVELNWNNNIDEDGDWIANAWEESDFGQDVGFQNQINNPNDDDETKNAKQARRDLEHDWRMNWEHGWNTTNSIKNPPKYKINIDEWDENDTPGYGLTIRNEKHVKEKENLIKLRDWSHVFPAISNP